MNTRDRFERVHGRKPNGRRFARLWNDVLDSENFRRLSPAAVKLWVELCRQYNGHNNGNLCIAWSLMQERGWTSKTPLHEAMRELIHYGFVIQVVKGKKYGGRHYPSLYARTDMPLDDVDDRVRGTRLAPDTWKEARAPFVKKKRVRKNPKYGHPVGTGTDG